MRIVGIGDLVCDIYYDESLKIIGGFGGGSSANIICNLQNIGFNTYYYGICGNDYQGKISKKSLDDCNVLNEIVILNNIKTKTYHILKKKENNREVFRSIKYCPFCRENSWYDESYIKEKVILKKILDDDILIFDNLNNKNQFIIDNTQNIKLLDLGTYYEFEKLSNEEIIGKLKNKYTIINLNERVEKYLIKRFNCENNIKLSKIINVPLLMITRGTRGNDFVYCERNYFYPLVEIVDEIDDSGAGDAFFSIIIKNWLNSKQKIESQKFPSWVKDTREYVKVVLLNIGSRTHIKKLYQIKEKNICQ